jgi:hypothetical protein
MGVVTEICIKYLYPWGSTRITGTNIYIYIYIYIYMYRIYGACVCISVA